MTDLTDTPIAPPTFPPPSRTDRLKALIGDLARPYAIIVVATACAIAIVKIAWDAGHLVEGAAFMTAALAGLAALYASKSAENAQAGKSAALVGVAQANAATGAQQ